MRETNVFDINLIKEYPHSHRKVDVSVRPYDICLEEKEEDSSRDQEGKIQTTYISPHGMEFQASTDYPEGTLLKISIVIPNYWEIKKRYVGYTRTEPPKNLSILAKVVASKDTGKRGRRKVIVAQTVNIDEIDEKVLISFLKEEK